MKKIIPYIILFLAFLFTVSPLLKSGFFPIHDSTQTARIHQMAQSLSEGQFPVRWVKDLGYGYGYPIFNFYAPLPYYVGALIHFVGFTYLQSTKIVMAIPILLSGLGMYHLVLDILKKRWIGLSAAVLYMYAPYQALDLYVRGAVGELWAIGFLPWLLLSIYNVINSPKTKASIGTILYSKHVLMGGFFLSAIVLSHTIAGMLTVIYTGTFMTLWSFYIAVKKRDITTCYSLLSILIFALGLSAFFWLPAFIELKYTSVSKLTGGGSDFRDHFVYLDQLWAAPWGFAGSAAGKADGMSFMVGKLHIVFALLSLVRIFTNRSLKSRYGNLSLIILILCVVFLFMVTPASFPIWEMLKYFSFVQFPWRHLMFVICFISILAVFWLELLPKQWFFSLLLCGIVVGYNGKYFKPQYLMDTKDNDYINKTVLQTETSRTIDEYMPLDFIRPTKNEQITQRIFSGSAGNNEKTTTTSFSITIGTDKRQTITLNRAYYPSWTLYIDDQKVEKGRIHGLLSVDLPQGVHTIKGVFQKTFVARLSELISVLSIVVMVSGALYAKQKISY